MIRASSLPGYADCARRWAARAMPRQLADAGFTVRELPPGIGAATGTATHAGAAMYIREGDAPGIDDHSIETLHTAIVDGVTYDATSPNLGDAEKQVLRQVAAYRQHASARFLLDTAGCYVEGSLKTSTGSGVEITGHPDLFYSDTLRDTKTGRVSRANGAQYGGYSLLLRAAGKRCARIIEDYIKRAPMRHPQPPAVMIEYDVAVAERSARAIIKRIISDVEAFDADGEPDVFLANPQSMMCGDKYCPAHGTRFCREWKR